jgi:hypothetical protein
VSLAPHGGQGHGRVAGAENAELHLILTLVVSCWRRGAALAAAAGGPRYVPEK